MIGMMKSGGFKVIKDHSVLSDWKYRLLDLGGGWTNFCTHGIMFP